MAGPGNFVSEVRKDGVQVWKPKVEQVRMPSDDKFRGRIPGAPILEADGKVRMAPNQAAVDSIKRMEGENATEMPVTLYPQTREAENLLKTAELERKIAELSKELKK